MESDSIICVVSLLVFCYIDIQWFVHPTAKAYLTELFITLHNANGHGNFGFRKVLIFVTVL